MHSSQAHALDRRYAPDDPTLPKPWKGIIASEVLYYWNPETGTVQYQKPVVTFPPPLPSGLPLSTPNFAPIPGGVGQPNRVPGQVMQMPQAIEQDMTSLPQQHYEYMSPTGNSNGFQYLQVMQQTGLHDGSTLPHSSHLTSQQGPSLQDSQVPPMYQNPHLDKQMGLYSGSTIPQPRHITSQEMRPQMLHQTSQQHQNFATYGYATGGPLFPNNALTPSPAIMSSLDASNLSPVDIYRQKHDITVTGDNVAPFMSFEDTPFPSDILKKIRATGVASPTPIQAQTWPIAVQGKDIVAIAKTRIGQTLGYLIPAFMHIKKFRNNSNDQRPLVVVLAPTILLASQIQAEAKKFGVSCKVIDVFPEPSELEDLGKKGADIVVATPDSLKQVIETKKALFDQVSLLVLDEADEMLEMGFELKIRTIIEQLPPQRQTLMFTTTWPKEVREIAADLLVKPVHVNIAANKSIKQIVEVIPELDKQRRVKQIIRLSGLDKPAPKFIILCSTKASCIKLAYDMRLNSGVNFIHEEMMKRDRDGALTEFHSDDSRILIATDVIARDFDMKDLSVINYDPPTDVKDYGHRIGRIERAGAKVVYTFLSNLNWEYAPELVNVLEEANQHVDSRVRALARHAGRSRNCGGMGRGGGDMSDGGFWWLYW